MPRVPDDQEILDMPWEEFLEAESRMEDRSHRKRKREKKMRDEGPSYGDRIAGGGIGGALAGYLLGRGKGALIGGLGGAASKAIGYGVSDDPVAGGALSDGLMGAGAGFVGAGTLPGGAELIKRLMQQGMSKRAAIAKVLGTAAGLGGIAGAGIGAAGGGLEKLARGDE